MNDLYRDTEIESLNWGITNFDNLAYAFLTIFQCTTMEGWTTIMYIYQNSYSKYVTPIYFILVILVCSFFILNLTIAIMLDKYEEISSANKDAGMLNELIDMGREAGLTDKIIEFLIEHDITVKNNAAKLKEDKTSLYKFFIYSHDLVVPQTKYYKFIIPRFFFRLVMTPFFNWFIFACIGMNTIILAMEKYPENGNTVQLVFTVLNYIFTTIFTLEVIFKFIGLGLKNF